MNSCFKFIKYVTQKYKNKMLFKIILNQKEFIKEKRNNEIDKYYCAINLVCF